MMDGTSINGMDELESGGSNTRELGEGAIIKKTAILQGVIDQFCSVVEDFERITDIHEVTSRNYYKLATNLKNSKDTDSVLKIFRNVHTYTGEVLKFLEKGEPDESKDHKTHNHYDEAKQLQGAGQTIETKSLFIKYFLSRHQPRFSGCIDRESGGSNTRELGEGAIIEKTAILQGVINKFSSVVVDFERITDIHKVTSRNYYKLATNLKNSKDTDSVLKIFRNVIEYTNIFENNLNLIRTGLEAYTGEVLKLLEKGEPDEPKDHKTHNHDEAKQLQGAGQTIDTKSLFIKYFLSRHQPRFSGCIDRESGGSNTRELGEGAIIEKTAILQGVINKFSSVVEDFERITDLHKVTSRNYYKLATNLKNSKDTDSVLKIFRNVIEYTNIFENNLNLIRTGLEAYTGEVLKLLEKGEPDEPKDHKTHESGGSNTRELGEGAIIEKTAILQGVINKFCSVVEDFERITDIQKVTSRNCYKLAKDLKNSKDTDSVLKIFRNVIEYTNIFENNLNLIRTGLEAYTGEVLKLLEKGEPDEPKDHKTHNYYKKAKHLKGAGRNRKS